MSMRILMIDDGRYIKKTMAQMMSCIGYEAVIAPDYTRAIELYQFAMELGHPYDAFILDVEELLEAYQNIRDIALEFNNPLTVIMINTAIAQIFTGNEKVLTLLAEAKEASIHIRKLVYQLMASIWPNYFQSEQNARY